MTLIKLLYTCLVVFSLSYKSFISCSILLINSFELLIFNLDKKIGKLMYPFPF